MSRKHLVPFISELHTFTANVGTKLVQEDKVVVYEAIAHVISAMPMDQAAESLKTFASTILAAVFALASKPGAATKQELQEVGCTFPCYLLTTMRSYWITDGLANLEVMLHVVGSFGEQLPPACHSTCQEDALNLFGPAVLTIAADVLERMSTAFASSGLSCYLWIASKVHSRFGNEEDPLLRNAVKDVYERSTQKLIVMLREKSATMLPDGDYFSGFSTVLGADW